MKDKMLGKTSQEKADTNQREMLAKRDTNQAEMKADLGERKAEMRAGHEMMAKLDAPRERMTAV
jgi:hypothetical protein